MGLEGGPQNQEAQGRGWGVLPSSLQSSKGPQEVASETVTSDCANGSHNENISFCHHAGRCDKARSHHLEGPPRNNGARSRKPGVSDFRQQFSRSWSTPEHPQPGPKEDMDSRAEIPKCHEDPH